MEKDGTPAWSVCPGTAAVGAVLLLGGVCAFGCAATQLAQQWGSSAHKAVLGAGGAYRSPVVWTTFP